MLDALVQTLRPAFEAAVAFAATAALVLSSSTASRRPLASASLGLLSAVLMALAIAAGLFAALLDPVSVDAVVGGLALVGLLALLTALALPRFPARAVRPFAVITLTAVLLPRGVALASLMATHSSALLMPDQTSMDSMGHDTLTGSAGLLLGLMIGVVCAAMLVGSARRSDRGRRLYAALPLAVLVVAQMAEAVRSAFAFGLLPMSPTLVGLLAPLMNATAPMFYALAAAVGISAGWSALRHATPPERPPANPAQARLLRAARRSQRRVSLFALLTAMLAVGLIAGQSVVLAREKAASVLTEPERLQPADDRVSVPIDQVSDGDMHRFSVTVEGTEVRFIVVHKGSGLYGTGLDACEICGPTGYFQRGKDVVCKACDVVIPIPTIGFNGGCNPVPLKYEKRDGALVFDMAELRAGVGEFE